MHICLIMDNPETPQHPVISPALQTLRARHSVRLLDIRTCSGSQAIDLEHTQTPGDLYLLKSHAPQALELAAALEQEGRRVVNSWSASQACQDRVQTSELLQAAHLPWPRTRAFPTLSAALREAETPGTFPTWPLIIKSRYSHRGDLVGKLNERAQLQALAAQWSQEPVVVQEWLPGDGWDIKLWIIDQRVFAARRRSPLEAQASRQDLPIAEHELPAAWRELALGIGRAFKMPLYGVDLLLTARGPWIVDINAFPGFRGVPGASEALVDLVERLLVGDQ
jgi:ribosomal protein S6--L-glutamate ligase